MNNQDQLVPSISDAEGGFLKEDLVRGQHI